MPDAMTIFHLLGDFPCFFYSQINYKFFLCEQAIYNCSNTDAGRKDLPPLGHRRLKTAPILISAACLTQLPPLA
jgi:hypothetical protein